MKKIRYLKTTEEFLFDLELPYQIKISDYNLATMIGDLDNRVDVDDDTYTEIRKLQKTHFLSYYLMKKAKTKQHLRELKRVESAWVEIPKRSAHNIFGRPKKEVADKERLEYLRENFESIRISCVKHDWFNEYVNLYRDVYPEIKRSEVVKKYKIDKCDLQKSRT